MVKICNFGELTTEEQAQAFSNLTSISLTLEEDEIDEEDIEQIAMALASSFVKNPESAWGDVYEEVYKNVYGDEPPSNPFESDDDEEENDDEEEGD